MRKIMLLFTVLLVGILFLNSFVIASPMTAESSEPDSLETNRKNGYEPCFAIALDLYSIDDTYASQQYPNENYGSSEDIRISNEYGEGGSSGWANDAYFIFDLHDLDIFVNREISSAELQFYYHDYEGTNPEGRTLNVYNITNDWNEKNLTWNNKPSYISKPISSATIPSSTGEWITFDISDDIQDRIDNYNFYINKGYRIADDTYRGQTGVPITIIKSKENKSYDPVIWVVYKISALQQNNHQSSFISNDQIHNLNLDDNTPPEISVTWII